MTGGDDHAWDDGPALMTVHLATEGLIGILLLLIAYRYLCEVGHRTDLPRPVVWLNAAILLCLGVLGTLLLAHVVTMWSR